MTAKDYNKFAAMVFSWQRDLDDPRDRMLIVAQAADMADIFAADNPRFDRARFMKACGLQ